MFTKLAPVVEKVDSTIRQIDSFSCLRKKLSDVLYEHQFIIILHKRVVGHQLPTLFDVTCCVRLHTLLHILACCESSCAKFETDQTFSYVQWTQQLPRILGVVNLSDIYDDLLSNCCGTALLRYSSSVNRSSIRHGLSAGANTNLYGVD